MIRTGLSRIDAKRRADIDYKKRQFATPQFQQQDYPHRLNFYTIPPTAEVSLEEFEEWAIARLKVLSELETCTFRNRSPDETAAYMLPILDKHLPLHSNSSRSSTLHAERRRDHYSHFILRLAFAGTEDLRRRLARLETTLFRLRLRADDARERAAFIDSLALEWERVSEAERGELGAEMVAAAGSGSMGAGAGAAAKGRTAVEEDGWFKVDWERVPELVEGRRVLVRQGKAYVPAREQTGLVVAEFTRRLEDALELTSRALPRLDEDDRLSPILAHLSRSFTTPDVAYTDGGLSAGSSLQPTAGNVPALATHMPPCMSTLQSTLSSTHHLKHFARLQYTLFLKGIGMSLEECLLFWRRSFTLITDDKFNKEYRYNVRHSYGDVGGDANRRGRGYSPYSCQKLLTEPLPGPGQQHGCPYRTYTPDNLVGLLRGMSVNDDATLRGVREDIGRQRYHVACNRVFEHVHKREIDRAKGQGWGPQQLDTLLHPNAYFKRSYELKHLDEVAADEAVKGEQMQL